MTEKKPGDKRRTTVHDRYTVGCSLCGLIDLGKLFWIYEKKYAKKEGK